MARRLVRAGAVAALLASSACGREPPAPPAGATTEEAFVRANPAPSGSDSATPLSRPSRDAITLIAGGDVSFGRVVGQMLIEKPATDFFAALRPWLHAADVRFANLEGPISDQHGETQKPGQPLVFTGPPEAAAALARARFTVVSTANNHAWDYGEPALRETLALLDGAGVLHVGTGESREASRRPIVVDVEGFRLAVLAVTDIWNQGPLEKHAAEPLVARADPAELQGAVRALRERGEADAIVVSYHGGEEYRDTPIPRTIAMLRAAIDAGADAVVGHHPHVIQGVSWYRGRPILYSLGNLLMRMHRDHPWTELGYMARLALRRGAPPAVWACPYRIFGVEVLPLAGERHREVLERRFYDHLAAISVPIGGTAMAPPGEDGCARLEAPREE
ncbi:Putative enzyme of poly-gamma-glutamate biosynthesis (capsule formation) [Minicystis rosea]|nr:Putative enzyme of poly-gamma-glutamate biosynthesis (capsule formation) [Minicystis rosea]